jgi:hypothetical protein
LLLGVSDEVSGEFSGEFPVDVSDDTHFCYNSFLFCYVVSGEVSGEPSLFLFLF